MKNKLIAILLLISFHSYSQISFEANTRTAKISSEFDYYFGVGIKDTIKKNLLYMAYTSYERDNNNMYHQYKASIKNDFFKLSHIKDTEKDIKLSSLNSFYTLKIKKAKINLGVDISHAVDYIYGAYIGIQYRFISLETAFDKRIYKVAYSINPKLNISDKLNLGVIIKGLYLKGNFKWRNGLNLTYNI